LKKLNRNTERILWIFGFLALLSFFHFAPSASSFKSQGDIDYYDKLFKTTLQYLNEYYVDSENTDLQKLYYGAIQGMFKATEDPYTALLEPEVLQSLMESIQGEFEGIGAYVGIKDNRIAIIAPIEGTPAYKAGVKAGDLIMKIEDKDTENMKLEEAVALLRGPANSKVTVDIYRKGMPDYLKITIERKKIEVPSVKSTVLNDGTGYLKITNFADTTPDEVKKALNAFNKKKIARLVVDLRYDPGGSLDAVVEIADFFLEKGLVVYTVGKKPNDNKKFYSTNKTYISPKLPMAVLINKGSASASEILAGALKDRKRAVILGEKSYGKGTVQNVFKLLDKNQMLGLKITIAKFYTPGGYVIEKNGIEPDIKVDMPKMTPEEEFAALKLIKDKEIQKFVEKNPKNISSLELEKFKKDLKSKGIIIGDLFLKKMIRDEQAYGNNPEVVDLEYDAQLKKAIEVLKK